MWYVKYILALFDWLNICNIKNTSDNWFERTCDEFHNNYY